MPTIRIYGCKAKELLAGDRTTSDPYISLMYNNMKRKSNVIKNTLNPDWPTFDVSYDFVRARRRDGMCDVLSSAFL